MDHFTVSLQPLGKTLRVRSGTSLHDVLQAYGVEFPCGGRGRCGACKVRLLEGDLLLDDNHREVLHELGLDHHWRLACRSRVLSDLVLEVAQYETIIRADESPVALFPREGLGIAFDLGTTTLVGQLLDLRNGRILGVETALNPQGRYGSDLISRIEAALDGKQDEMQVLIREKCGAMVEALLADRHDEAEVVFVGNTVMHHFFCGFDVTPLSFYPFESGQLGAHEPSPAALGWSVPGARIRFLPSIGSFVGSDILAGVLATGMHRSEGLQVLVDLGTNGEIVAGDRHGLLCASTAAGPAFEGARISCGMLAVSGAISSAQYTGEGWKLDVIGNCEARGICGSGLIDLIAGLWRHRLIGHYGEISSGGEQIAVAEGVSITRADIQEFLLAKAAITTGIDLLLEQLSRSRDEVETVYIAGGFGSYLEPAHMQETGMLPFPVSRIRRMGNTALMGARMCLVGDRSEETEALARMRHVNLEGLSGFQDRYIAQLCFEE